MSKKAGRKFNPKKPTKSAGAIPANRHRVESNLDHSPVWQLKILDMDDEAWGWKNLKNSHLGEVLQKLKNYESRLWKEILRDKKRDHGIAFDKLSLAAQKRLATLGLDDIDELFRLRLNGSQRVWGILERSSRKIILTILEKGFQRWKMKYRLTKLFNAYYSLHQGLGITRDSDEIRIFNPYLNSNNMSAVEIERIYFNTKFYGAVQIEQLCKDGKAWPIELGLVEEEF